MTSQFAADIAHAVDASEEVDIETERRTTIWAVVADGDIYVRSVHGARGLWYQAISQNPVAGLWVGERRLAVRAVPVTDPALIDRASAAYSVKYRESQWLPDILMEATLPTTLRLEPA